MDVRPLIEVKKRGRYAREREHSITTIFRAARTMMTLTLLALGMRDQYWTVQMPAQQLWLLCGNILKNAGAMLSGGVAGVFLSDLRCRRFWRWRESREVE